MKEIKEFFVSYHEAIKPYKQWCKEHRKGRFICTGTLLAIEYGYVFREQIKDKFHEIKEKVTSKF